MSARDQGDAPKGCQVTWQGAVRLVAALASGGRRQPHRHPREADVGAAGPPVCSPLRVADVPEVLGRPGGASAEEPLQVGAGVRGLLVPMVFFLFFLPNVPDPVEGIFAGWLQVA
jgi:hypothetical protein